MRTTQIATRQVPTRIKAREVFFQQKGEASAIATDASIVTAVFDWLWAAAPLDIWARHPQLNSSSEHTLKATACVAITAALLHYS